MTPTSALALNMTLARECVCPVVVTRGADQVRTRASRGQPLRRRHANHLLPRGGSSCSAAQTVLRRAPPVYSLAHRVRPSHTRPATALPHCGAARPPDRGVHALRVAVG